MRIAIAEITGPVAAGRSTAATLRGEIESAAARDSVVLDFSGVRVVAPSFADELVAKLPANVLEGGVVSVEGADATTVRLIDMVRRRRVPA